MTGTISSAEPEKLLRYSDLGLQLDGEVAVESARLAGTLQQFEAQCTEPGCQVSVGGHAQTLSQYGMESATLGNWVGDVARGFLLADSGSIGAAPAQAWPVLPPGWRWAWPGIGLPWLPIVIGVLPFLPWLWPIIIAREWLQKLLPTAEPTQITRPGGQPSQYAVQSGDTLSAIAQRFGVSVAAIVAANNLADPNLIRTGQILTIPGTSTQPISAPTPETPAPTTPAPGGTDTGTYNPDAPTDDCVKFVKGQPGRKVPTGFSDTEFYSGDYKGKSGTLSDGTQYGQEPRVGVIMVESPNKDAGITYGHASYVYEVRRDASGRMIGFTVAEGNWPSGTTVVHTEQFHWDESKGCFVSGSGKRSPDMFIY